MVFKKAIETISLVSCLFCIVLPADFVSAEPEHSAWQCLPEETVFAARIPNGSQFGEALVKNTKLGTLLFSEKNKAELINVLEQIGEEWEDFQQSLEEFGLSTDDLIQILAGDSGFALLVENETGDQPRPSSLAWIGPGEELTGRAFEILSKVIASQEDAAHPIRRLDLEIADRPVMQLQIPSEGVKYDKEFDMGDMEGLSKEERREAWKEAYDEVQESRVEIVKYRTLLVCPLGGRILLAFGSRAVLEEDLDEQSDMVGSLLGKWLAAHESGDGGFVSRLEEEAIVNRTMALEGVSGLELLVDFQALVQLANTLTESQPGAGDAWNKAAQLLGLEGVGSGAMKLALDGTQLRSALSISIPSPRTGLMVMLDQEPIPAEPPAWVPASAVRYAHLSFDLGKFFGTLKEELTKAFPDRADQWFQMADMQVNSFAKTGLEELLDSIDSRHSLVSFGIDKDAFVSEDGKPDEKRALVWSIEEETLWSRLLDAMKPFATMANAEASEQQGYRGFRIKNERIEGGLMLGKGYLVLGIGAEVLETTIASLNNPPSSDDSFRASEIYERASNLLDLQPCMGLEVTNGSRYMSDLWRVMEYQFKEVEEEYADYEDEDEQEIAELLWKLIPNADEVEEIFGVIVTSFEVNEDGLYLGSVTELPAP